MRTIPFGKIKSYAILIHSELPHLIEGEASCFTEAFSLSTGLSSGRSNPTLYKFIDAFISLLWYVPQIGHCQYLSDSFNSLCLYPHTLHSLELG